MDMEHSLRRNRAISLGAGLNHVHLGNGLNQEKDFDEPDGDTSEQKSFLHSKCKYQVIKNQYLKSTCVLYIPWLACSRNHQSINQVFLERLNWLKEQDKRSIYLFNECRVINNI